MPDVEKLDITVDAEECIGCGACVTEAPETFELNDDDKAVVKQGPRDNLEFIMSGAEACPINAITIVDTESGQQLFPEA